MAREKKKSETHPLLLGLKSVEPYSLVDTASLWAEQPPPMLIESFLPAGGVMGITSYPGVGKTWLALEVIRAVATGTKFLGRFTGSRGGAIFVGSDSSVYDYARQWRRLTEGDEGPARFDAARFLLQSSFMFESFDEVRRLIRTCRDFRWGESKILGEGEDAVLTRSKGVDVIIFDTLSRLTRANQNDNTEMEEVFRNIRHIAEFTGAACILLHHNAKKSEYNDGADWRGAMSQIGALDSWVQLIQPRASVRREAEADGAKVVGVQFKKFRGITPEDFSYRMEVNDAKSARLYASDDPITSQQKLTGDAVAEAVLAMIAAKPGLTMSQLRDELWPQFDMNGFTEKVKFSKAVENRLYTMSSRGKIEKVHNEKGKPVYNPVKVDA